MKNVIFLLLISLFACSQQEDVKLKSKVNRQKLVGNYHSFSSINGRDNSTFLAYTTWEGIRVDQYFNAYSLNPIPKYMGQFAVAADWFDWENDVTEDVTFEVYVSPTTITNTTPDDSVFVLVGSTSSFDTQIFIDLSASYPFGSIENKVGQYVHFKFQWRDSVDNLSTPVYESKQIEIDSSAEVAGVKASVDGWLHDTFTIDAIEEVHILDTIVSSGGSFFITQDTLFNNSLYIGKVNFTMSKTNPCIAGVGFMFDQAGNYSDIDDWTGTCCSPLDIDNWPYQFSVVKVHSACPITLIYKFDGIRTTFH